MDTDEDLHYKPKYLPPQHALIPKKCRFCHNDMEIKQINSSEAFRMCFKCPTPLQQLDLDEIEFFHRSYKDMLKSPLEWSTNLCDKEDDLAKLSLWIEQMELKVSKYEDSSDEETLDSHRVTGQLSGNPALEESLHDWQSELDNDLEAALEKASCEKLQPHNLPFSFDDFFLPSNQVIEKSPITPSTPCFSSTEGLQKLGSCNSESEISEEKAIQISESDSHQSQTLLDHGNNAHLEEMPMTRDVNCIKIQQTDSKKSLFSEDIGTIIDEQAQTTSANSVQESDPMSECLVTQSAMQLGNVVCERMVPHATLECLEKENTLQTNAVDELNTVINIAEMPIREGNATELSASKPPHATLECLKKENTLQTNTVDELNTLINIAEMPISEGNATELSASKPPNFESSSAFEECSNICPATESCQKNLDDKNETLEDITRTENCSSSNSPGIYKKKTKSGNHVELKNEAMVGDGCVEMQVVKLEASPTQVKDHSHNNLSGSVSPTSSATHLSPCTSMSVSEEYQNHAESITQYAGFPKDERPKGEAANTVLECLSQSTVPQVENDSDQIIFSNKCGSTVPPGLWSSVHLAGYSLVYEHVCDCDEEQIQLSPAKNDGDDNQCINLVLPDLSPSSLLEEDIRKSSAGSFSLDKILFLPQDKPVKKKCLSRKLDFTETAIEKTNESKPAIPILVATIPADSDITQDMLQAVPDENMQIILEDSVDGMELSNDQSVCRNVEESQHCNNNSLVDVNLERSVTPINTQNSFEANKTLPLNKGIPLNGISEGQINLDIGLDKNSLGMTLKVEDFNIKINFAPETNNMSSIICDNVLNNAEDQEMVNDPLQDLQETFSNTSENPAAHIDFCDVESYDSGSYSETSTYTQFVEDIDQTCSSSSSVRKGNTLPMDEKSFSMMIDRPLQLHGITVEDDDEELKCFAGAKFKPIGNRKPSLKEGKIESEPRLLNLLTSVRREIKMAKPVQRK